MVAYYTWAATSDAGNMLREQIALLYTSINRVQTIEPYAVKPTGKHLC